jgi:hypothetical protein
MLSIEFRAVYCHSALVSLTICVARNMACLASKRPWVQIRRERERERKGGGGEGKEGD